MRKPVCFALLAGALTVALAACSSGGTPSVTISGDGGSTTIGAASAAAAGPQIPVPAAGANGWAGGTLDANGDADNSVSCPTATFCLAVDASYNAFTFNGSAWTGPTVVDPAAAASAAQAQVAYVSVSCATPQSSYSTARRGRRRTRLASTAA
jgi:hypothetical protein